jgi:hypothetical protein
MARFRTEVTSPRDICQWAGFSVEACSSNGTAESPIIEPTTTVAETSFGQGRRRKLVEQLSYPWETAISVHGHQERQLLYAKGADVVHTEYSKRLRQTHDKTPATDVAPKNVPKVEAATVQLTEIAKRTEQDTKLTPQRRVVTQASVLLKGVNNSTVDKTSSASKIKSFQEFSFAHPHERSQESVTHSRHSAADKNDNDDVEVRRIVQPKSRSKSAFRLFKPRKKEPQKKAPPKRDIKIEWSDLDREDLWLSDIVSMISM